MNKYLFKTTTTMKEYNNKKWWIANDIIPNMTISADTVFEALNKYRDEVNKKTCITISNNALKTKNPMYIETKDGDKQIGYVITGKYDFQDDDSYKLSTQYIDLWISIYIISDVDFE